MYGQPWKPVKKTGTLDRELNTIEEADRRMNVPNGPLGIVADYLERIADVQKSKSDAQLLALFAEGRDEEAFAELVERHGPMVMGVCRRALGNSADAEDAFQATFLALARSSGKIGTNVPGWLYRVAVRTSRKALRRRSPSEVLGEGVNSSDPFADVEWREVRRLLDEELEKLPAKWRSPLVLCYLESLTRDEAASRLGLSLRTLHRRLDEGRSKLRERLARRGLAPGVLALLVLPGSSLVANVPPEVVGQTVLLATELSDIPVSIQTLMNTSSLRGLVMKTTLCAGLMAIGFSLILANRQPVAADPVPTGSLPTTVLVRAPLKKSEPEDPMAKKVQEAQKKAIEFIKSRQTERGEGKWNWEDDTFTILQPGGTSALAILALLESGLKADDEIVARGLKYLRTLKPKHTYVVGLQTQVFCKANQKEDAERIKGNVKWLEEAAIWDSGKLLGWSYSANSGNRSDNSNNRYALAGLFAAHKAGFKTKKEGFWEEVRATYGRMQGKEGGWSYTNAAGPGTLTMTASGVLVLLQANEVLGKEDKATAAATKAGFAWIEKEFRFENSPHTFYSFDVIAALGRASEKKDLGSKDKKIEWYKDGCEWLLKKQKPTGEWMIDKSIDAFPVISTSFALRFLASRPD